MNRFAGRRGKILVCKPGSFKTFRQTYSQIILGKAYCARRKKALVKTLGCKRTILLLNMAEHDQNVGQFVQFISGFASWIG